MSVGNMNFALTITNNETAPVDIRDLELVYFYTPGSVAGSTFQLFFAAGTTPVFATQSVTTTDPEATDYISVTFDTTCSGSCDIAPNGGSIGPISFGAFPTNSGATYDMTDDYSFSAGMSPCGNMLIRLGDVIVYGTPPAGLPTNW
jgi:hypothetical protein